MKETKASLQRQLDECEEKRHLLQTQVFDHMDFDDVYTAALEEFLDAGDDPDALEHARDSARAALGRIRDNYITPDGGRYVTDSQDGEAEE